MNESDSEQDTTDDEGQDDAGNSYEPSDKKKKGAHGAGFLHHLV